MRIDGPNNVQVHGSSDPDGKTPQSNASGGTGGAKPAGNYVHVDPAYEPYLQKVRACEDVDLQAVAEAKELLGSGQLDTPQAAARAAENILSRGI